ncbi:MAG: sulfurtransferase TusA family protein [Gemmataceae bacterium]
MTEPKYVDLSGMKCPMPIVELNRLMKELAAGTELTVRADDPAFELDVQAWSRRTGHELVRVESSPPHLNATIRKKRE